MTTESDFQALLDEYPDDHYTRLVFADWLQEREDPRADGYQVMGALRPRLYDHSRESTPVGYAWWKFGSFDSYECPQCPDWWALIEDGAPFPQYTMGRFFKTRREAEDAAALGFARLPADRRAELLAGKAVAA